MASTHEGKLRLPHLDELPKACSHVDLFPNINLSLIGISAFTDAGCEVSFDKDKCLIHKNGKAILWGKKDPSTNLWHASTEDLPSPKHVANFARHVDSAINKHSAAERVAFLHACAGYPALSTWCKAIDAGHYATWPNLTSELVRKHPPQSKPMVKGHLDQQRQGIQSTKKVQQDEPITDIQIPLHKQEPRTHAQFVQVVEISGQVYTDQTGRFPIPSTSGAVYLMILYDYDSNAIRAEPMKSREASEMAQAYQRHHDYLTKRGLRPKLQILDNEISKTFADLLDALEVDYQLAPPHSHRRNAAERAIRTFKAHFIAILCGVDPEFPLYLWDRLLPQAMLTLNLLRTSRINPRLSAEEQLNGIFDFNRTPIGPLGTRVVVHEMPDTRVLIRTDPRTICR